MTTAHFLPAYTGIIVDNPNRYAARAASNNQPNEATRQRAGSRVQRQSPDRTGAQQLLWITQNKPHAADAQQHRLPACLVDLASQLADVDVDKIDQ